MSSSLLLTSQQSLVLVTLVHTLSGVLDSFLLRLRGVSHWPCPGCADSRCALCTLLDLLVPLRVSRSWVLSVACVGMLLRSHGLSTPQKGTTPHCAAHVSLMLSRHHSPCSLTSALICAVLHTSLESSPAGCAREYQSCALRETTYHCLSLKAVLSSRLRDSTTAWSAEAFNATCVVVVRSKSSRVPSLFLSCTAARWPSTHAVLVFVRGLQ